MESSKKIDKVVAHLSALLATALSAYYIISLSVVALEQSSFLAQAVTGLLSLAILPFVFLIYTLSRILTPKSFSNSENGTVDIGRNNNFTRQQNNHLEQIASPPKLNVWANSSSTPTPVAVTVGGNQHPWQTPPPGCSNDQSVISSCLNQTDVVECENHIGCCVVVLKRCSFWWLALSLLILSVSFAGREIMLTLAVMMFSTGNGIAHQAFQPIALVLTAFLAWLLFKKTATNGLRSIQIRDILPIGPILLATTGLIIGTLDSNRTPSYEDSTRRVDELLTVLLPLSASFILLALKTSLQRTSKATVWFMVLLLSNLLIVPTCFLFELWFFREWKVEGMFDEAVSMSFLSWTSVIFCGISTAVILFLWIKSIAVIGVIRVSLYFALLPLFLCLFEQIVFLEIASNFLWIGQFLVVIALYIYELTKF